MDKRTRSSCSRSNWSDLPSDLLDKIAKLLPTRTDNLRLRSVCRSFRSALPSTTKIIPSLKLPLPKHINSTSWSHLLLTESIIYAMEPLGEIAPKSYSSTKTWLIKIQELDSGRILFKEPFHNHSWTRKKLSEKLPEFINISDYHLIEIAKVHGLEFVAADGTKGKPSFGNFKKVVVSKCLDNTDDGFAVMAIYRSLWKLGVWRYGDNKWTELDSGRFISRIWVHIVYHDGNFCALDSDGRVLIVDPMSLEEKEVYIPSIVNPWENYLMKSVDDLFMIQKIHRHPHQISLFSKHVQKCSISLNVFKLDQANLEWIQVTDGLLDKVLFLGDDYSFSLFADEFSDVPRNCVCVAEMSHKYLHEHVDFDFPGCHIKIFDLENKMFGLLRYLPHCLKIFWPPPIWVKNYSKSSC